MDEADDRLLGLFPLGIVLLPGEVVPLHIFEERYKKLIGERLEDGEFGIVLAEDDSVRECGTAARVVELIEEMDDGRMNVLVEGGRRFRIVEVHEPEDSEAEYLSAEVDFYRDSQPEASQAAARRRAGSVREDARAHGRGRPQGAGRRGAALVPRGVDRGLRRAAQAGAARVAERGAAPRDAAHGDDLAAAAARAAQGARRGDPRQRQGISRAAARSCRGGPRPAVRARGAPRPAAAPRRSPASPCRRPPWPRSRRRWRPLPLARRCSGS